MKIMKIVISLFFLFSAYIASIACSTSDKIIVAVIDTGFGYIGQGKSAPLCSYGHRDFTLDNAYAKGFKTTSPVPLDTHSHGTNLVGIIDDRTKEVAGKYCVVILKIYPSDMGASVDVAKYSAKAIDYATRINAKIINFSGGGTPQDSEETAAVKRFLRSGGTFVAAAGNSGGVLGSYGNTYFPAQADPGVIIVGSKCNGQRAFTSNYGDKIDEWECGESVTGYGLTLSGTSQATAIVTSKKIVELVKSNDRK